MGKSKEQDSNEQKKITVAPPLTAVKDMTYDISDPEVAAFITKFIIKK